MTCIVAENERRQEGAMSFKSLIAGGALVLATTFGLGLAADTAEAKTKVHVSIGFGSPYYVHGYRHGYYGYRGCVNPGILDWCGAGIYRSRFDDPFFDPRPRYHPRYRLARSCDAAARAIRHAGYRNIRSTDCDGRYYGFRATKRGKVYALRVDNRTGRISIR
jgi:hypothetical protein